MSNYYNEWDKDAAAWLRELIKAGLIPAGDVDERSITEVKAHELTDYTQCHFFCGIAGWPLAFQLAGVPHTESADTGSCPCQPFSGTGKQMGFADPRHLWPAFRRIIGKRQSPTVYGEQVASKLGREWLARVFSDLAFMGYAGSGADLCSAGVGSPNIRQRLYWVGDADLQRCAGFDALLRQDSSRRDAADISEAAGRGAVERLEHPPSDGRQQRGTESDGRSIAGGCESGGLANAAGQRFGEARSSGGGQEERIGGGRAVVGLGYADHARREGRIIRWHGGYERAARETGVAGPATLGGFWGVADLVFCRDEKWRRIESGSFPLAHGIPSRVGPLLTELRKLGRSSIALARANRNIRLKGYGNAINPWVAARFVAAHRARVDGSRLTQQPETMEVG